MIYFLHAPEVGRIKIGYSKCWEQRFLDLMVGCPTPLDVLALADCSHADEQALHKVFADARFRGEWFAATPALLGFCRCLKEAGETAARAIVHATIEAHRAKLTADKAEWDSDAETAVLRLCLRAFVEKHGPAVTAVVAGLGEQMVRNLAKGQNSLSPVRLLRLQRHDPEPFDPFFAYYGMRFEGDPALKVKCSLIRSNAA